MPKGEEAAQGREGEAAPVGPAIPTRSPFTSQISTRCPFSQEEVKALTKARVCNVRTRHPQEEPPTSVCSFSEMGVIVDLLWGVVGVKRGCSGPTPWKEPSSPLPGGRSCLGFSPVLW